MKHVGGALQKIQEAVMTWEGVTSQPHRFGGIEFRYGKLELGHVHGDYLVDIPFPMKTRNALIESHSAVPHHIMPESGWVSFYINDEKDIDAAIELLKLSYSSARRRKIRTTQSKA